MAGTYIGTTHTSRHNGHGHKVARSRFAIPTVGHVRGQPEHGKSAPWWLKHWGSRPTYKQRRAFAAAA